MALVVLLLCPGTSREMPSKVRSGLMVVLVGGHGWKYLQQHQQSVQGRLTEGASWRQCSARRSSRPTSCQGLFSGLDNQREDI